MTWNLAQLHDHTRFTVVLCLHSSGSLAGLGDNYCFSLSSCLMCRLPDAGLYIPADPAFCFQDELPLAWVLKGNHFFPSLQLVADLFIMHTEK